MVLGNEAGVGDGGLLARTLPDIAVTKKIQKNVQTRRFESQTGSVEWGSGKSKVGEERMSTWREAVREAA